MRKYKVIRKNFLLCITPFSTISKCSNLFFFEDNKNTGMCNLNLLKGICETYLSVKYSNQLNFFLGKTHVV